MKHINLYSQEDYHDDATIIATKEGLEALRNVIDNLLSGKTSRAIGKKIDAIYSYDSDGEGYRLFVEMLEEKEFVDIKSPISTLFYKENKKEHTVTDMMDDLLERKTTIVMPAVKE